MSFDIWELACLSLLKSYSIQYYGQIDRLMDRQMDRWTVELTDRLD